VTISKVWTVTNSPLVIVGLITVVGAALWFYHLGFKPLWVDEAVLYWIAYGGNLKKYNLAKYHPE
jgi:membrane protein YdbS with pleckstrin-like domain